jgi:hypothetical protein
MHVVPGHEEVPFAPSARWRRAPLQTRIKRHGERAAVTSGIAVREFLAVPREQRGWEPWGWALSGAPSASSSCTCRSESLATVHVAAAVHVARTARPHPFDRSAAG